MVLGNSKASGVRCKYSGRQWSTRHVSHTWKYCVNMIFETVCATYAMNVVSFEHWTQGLNPSHYTFCQRDGSIESGPRPLVTGSCETIFQGKNGNQIVHTLNPSIVQGLQGDSSLNHSSSSKILRSIDDLTRPKDSTTRGQGSLPGTESSDAEISCTFFATGWGRKGSLTTADGVRISLLRFAWTPGAVDLYELST